MKLHRKIKHNEKLCDAQHTNKLGFHVQGQGCSQGSEVKSSFCNNLKPTEANFVKLHTKINHNEKVYHTQYLYSQVNVKVIVWGQRSEYICAITLKSTIAKFINIHRLIRHH